MFLRYNGCDVLKMSIIAKIKANNLLESISRAQKFKGPRPFNKSDNSFSIILCVTNDNSLYICARASGACFRALNWYPTLPV